jgi:hypothetical protein
MFGVECSTTRFGSLTDAYKNQHSIKTAMNISGKCDYQMKVLLSFLFCITTEQYLSMSEIVTVLKESLKQIQFLHITDYTNYFYQFIFASYKTHLISNI